MNDDKKDSELRQSLEQKRKLLNDKLSDSQFSLAGILIKERQEELKKEMKKYDEFSKNLKGPLSQYLSTLKKQEK